MNRIARIVLLFCVTLILTSCQVDQTADTKPISHSFLCSDYGQNMVCIVSSEGDIIWEYPAKRPQDVWQMPNGNILLTTVRSAVEVTRDKRVVWEYKTEKPNEIHACQPLPDGGYLVAISGPCEIVEVDRAGKVTKTVKLVTNQKKTHAQMRLVRKTANGNYLVGHNMDGVVREYDPAGKVVRTFTVEGNPYSGIRLGNGNTIIACGDGHKIIEVDPDDKIVWQLNENDLPGNPLRFVAGIQRLPNGNTVVCNWGGHGHIGEQPQIFEVTPNKEVVWQFSDWTKLNTISNIQLLDVPSDVTKGQIIR